VPHDVIARSNRPAGGPADEGITPSLATPQARRSALCERDASIRPQALMLGACKHHKGIADGVQG